MIKQIDVVTMYRKLLYPMGYMVVPKPEIKGTGWEPSGDSKKKYEHLSSGDIENEVNELRTKQNSLSVQLADTKKKVVAILETIPPSDATRDYYQDNYNKTSSNLIVGKVKLDSKRITEINNLINYLTNMKKDKIRAELLKKLQEKDSSIESVEFESGTSSGIYIRAK